MRLSRPAFCSALCSCLTHSIALGLAATFLVSPPQSPSHVVKVTLLRRAVPLPVGSGGETGKGAPAPASEKTTTIVPQPPPRPRPKPVAKKPRPVMKIAPPPIETAPQLALAVPPPIAAPVPDGAIADLSGGNSEGNDNEGAGGSGSKIGTGSGSGSGHGGGGGTSARPDYGINPKPPYPLLARRVGAQGVVLLRVHVREDGSVAAVELARSSGFALLDESASRTVRESWRFLPARRDGVPIASWVEVPIRFVLEGS